MASFWNFSSVSSSSSDDESDDSTEKNITKTQKLDQILKIKLKLVFNVAGVAELFVFTNSPRVRNLPVDSWETRTLAAIT